MKEQDDTMSIDHDPWGDQFHEQERSLLAPFVTDLDSSVFGLRNLPEVVKGALFSRYSRTDKSLRRILLDEFLQTPEAGLSELRGNSSTDQLVAINKAEAFYERVLVGYGDDSVAELSGAHVACEGISNIAAKVLEDSRIGISPLEKSTRYVVFNRKRNGQYRYLREPAIQQSAFASQYEDALDGLFDCYSELLDPMLAHVRAETPRDAGTSERAYNSATRAKAFDILRGLLPMATLTNVGLFGNGRAFEHLLNRLYAAPTAELTSLATTLQAALDQLIPSFVKRPKTERGQLQHRYKRETRAQIAALVDQYQETLPEVVLPVEARSHGVTLVDYDTDAELRVVAAILYTGSEHALSAARTIAERISATERQQLIRAYVGNRQSRFQRPGRAFEEARYRFDIIADIGAYRDLQRHRILTQERQRFATNLGFITPAEIIAAGLEQPYTSALARAADASEQIAQTMPEQAQYAVPMAFRMRWRITLNLRELYHLVELRSAPQGHPTYRRVAQAMFSLVQAVHPSLVEGMRFVDMGDYALERLDAERRLDEKMKRLDGSQLGSNQPI
jgi:thymidylate synthase ThyX